MKKHLLLLACLCACIILNAQSFINALHYGTASMADIGFGVCTDAGGNVIMTGTHTDSVTFGTTVLHATLSDAFIVKYNANMVVQWAKRVTGAGNQDGRKVVTDASGNIYVTGHFYSSCSIDTFNITGGNGSWIFLIKLNSSGVVQWVKSIGGDQADNKVNAISLDGSNNIYLAGEYSDTIYYGNGIYTTSVVHPLNLTGSVDCFVAKFNNSGVCQWARKGGSYDTERAYDMDVDAAGNAYITGLFQYTATFTSTTGSGSITAAGSVDGFVARYNTTGHLTLLLKFGSPDYEAGYGIALDNMWHFYVTGLHNGFTLFDTITATPNGSYDMFLAKYTTNGNAVWVRSSLSSQWEWGWTVEVDDQGSPHVGAINYHSGTSMFNEMYMTSVGYYVLL